MVEMQKTSQFKAKLEQKEGKMEKRGWHGGAMPWHPDRATPGS